MSKGTVSRRHEALPHSPRTIDRHAAGPAVRMLTVAVLLATGCASHGGTKNPPGLDTLRSNPAGADFEAFLRESVLASEAFRRTLLAGVKGSLLAQSIEHFQEHAAPFLRNRFSVSRFLLGHEELLKRMAGSDSLSGERIYGPFEGRWHGLWTDFEVDHHWAKTETFDPPRRFELDGSPVWVRSSQYAWIGDGYGLNLVATITPDRADRDFLLGHVIHVEDGDLNRPRKQRPHVGIDSGEGKIIWATAGEVFLEERIVTTEGTEAYVITGFYYGVQNGVLTIQDGFQALYTRDAENRPKFFKFPIRAEIAAK